MGEVAAIAAIVGAATSVYSASESQKNTLAAGDRVKNEKRRQEELIAEGKQKKKLADEQTNQTILANRDIKKPTQATESTLVTSPLGSSPTPYGGNKRQLGV